ncbi:DNA-binding protein [Lysinibacillus fusiformis]|uniref:DNA-binding protein n=1 Tax=Lysinibacillus fusiformis TaxID=28031 RepID=UPI0011BBCAA6|nr:DNA-binding protein [Lysinibacillus fusiformis]QEA01275.1 DNA-binding protein [Lysinibacillus fusiformis]
MIPSLEEQLKVVVLTATKEAIEDGRKQLAAREWMSLKEGAVYANVSYNSFIKFRERGLKVFEIDGIKRVSKKEIDIFLEKNSY